MASDNDNEKKNDPTKEPLPLFATEGDDDDGEWFRDKVRAVFEHFDTDGDEHLLFTELAALQKATAGTTLTEEMYIMACRALNCQPNVGISLDALKLTYAAEGTDIEKDYYTIFPERDPTKSNHELKKDKDDDDEIYEVGTDGTIDISS